ncbi:MAG: hypothetical protein LCH63_17470 [Candidatus Melainabacteria bacterium]|nr:hypothetical protein [Candidatus Melainabacteria bacterium]
MKVSICSSGKLEIYQRRSSVFVIAIEAKEAARIKSLSCFGGLLGCKRDFCFLQYVSP